MRVSAWQTVLYACFFALSATALWFLHQGEYLSFQNLVAKRDALVALAENHYGATACAYVAVVVATAFFVPGAIVATLAGGLLFGVVQGVLLFNVGSALGAATAFLLARHALGERLQKRYEKQLAGLNRELERHGRNYLVALRIVPVMPFFLMNYLAGLTNVPVRTFLWTTAAGMLPGSVVYCYAGSRLGRIESPGDVMSPETVAACALLALFALLPPLRHWGGKLMSRS